MSADCIRFWHAWLYALVQHLSNTRQYYNKACVLVKMRTNTVSTPRLSQRDEMRIITYSFHNKNSEKLLFIPDEVSV